MPYEVGISSGIMGAARPEEASQYVGLARKAYYGITQGVKFVQIDLESISELEQEGLEEEIKKVKTEKELEEARIRYLGRKSVINQLFSQLPKLEKEKRAYIGRRLNLLKEKVERLIKEKKLQFEKKEEEIDFTVISPCLHIGRKHILTQVIEEICQIFKNLGFQIIEGNEIEDCLLYTSPSPRDRG